MVSRRAPTTHGERKRYATRGRSSVMACPFDSVLARSGLFVSAGQGLLCFLDEAFRRCPWRRLLEHDVVVDALEGRLDGAAALWRGCWCLRELRPDQLLIVVCQLLRAGKRLPDGRAVVCVDRHAPAHAKDLRGLRVV